MGRVLAAHQGASDTRGRFVQKTAEKTRQEDDALFRNFASDQRGVFAGNIRIFPRKDSDIFRNFEGSDQRGVFARLFGIPLAG